jgi:hypothetical protein
LRQRSRRDRNARHNGDSREQRSDNSCMCMHGALNRLTEGARVYAAAGQRARPLSCTRVCLRIGPTENRRAQGSRIRALPASRTCR